MDTQYAIIAILLVVIIIGVIIMFQRKKSVKDDIETKEKPQMTPEPIEENEVSIIMEKLPIEMLPDDKQLVEVTDKTVIEQMDGIIPSHEQAAVTESDVRQESGEAIYKATIPVKDSAKLLESKNIEDAVKSIYQGANKIKKYGNAVVVKGTKTMVATSAAAAMGIATLVVVQYYMTQINKGLLEIKDKLAEISAYQRNEYKSKILALLNFLENLPSNKDEILADKTSRTEMSNQLNMFEHECAQLLEQANCFVTDIAQNQESDYHRYEKKVRDAHEWYMYQQILLEIMSWISDLKYVHNRGKASIEQCKRMLMKCLEHSNESRARLMKWHEDNRIRFNIDISTGQRKRSGKGQCKHFLKHIMKKDRFQKYAQLGEDIKDMIEIQSSEVDYEYAMLRSEPFEKNVELIFKDGKVFYMPPSDRLRQNI